MLFHLSLIIVKQSINHLYVLGTNKFAKRKNNHIIIGLEKWINIFF